MPPLWQHAAVLPFQTMPGTVTSCEHQGDHSNAREA